MQFINLTRDIEIGANCYALKIGGRTVVLDSGMHPEHEGEESLPNFGLLEPDSVDAIILSHAHHDHLGSLPVLMRRQPRAPVFMSEATRILADVMLHNSVNVMTRQREELGRTDLPMFTHKGVDEAAWRWMGRPLHQRYTLDGERVGNGERSRRARSGGRGTSGATGDDGEVTFEFYDAGHVLGAVGTLFRAEGRTVFYSGDVNFEDQSISRAARFPEEHIDVLIVETTRGDHATPADYSRQKEERRLAGAINDAFARGGTVVMPLFALGKTQELLAMFHGMIQRGQIPQVPIYIGGLSAKLTEIYDKLAHTAPRLKPGLQLFDKVKPFVLAGPEALDTPIKPRRIYALSSGMMTEKTLSNVFARRILGDPAHSLVFVGYADPHSPAGRLRLADPDEAVTLDPDFEPQPVRCKVEQFHFSGHASREMIRAYVNNVAPSKVVLVHGDPPAVAWFRKALSADLPRTEVITPTPGQPVEL